MGCASCGGNKSAPQLRWTVDLTVPAAGGKKFSDGSTKKTFATPGEANQAVQGLGLSGIVRPRPANPGE